MDPAAWIELLDTLRAEHPHGFYANKRDWERFAEFVRQLPVGDRIPTLLEAYDRYRAGDLCAPAGSDQNFESSCYSILISTILASGIRPTQPEACEILRRSHHFCGHGPDVEPPLTLAEKAVRNAPYSTALFDAVEAYSETLRGLRSSRAASVKTKLNWVLWHDFRRTRSRCYTRRIQQSLQAMGEVQRFHWQWLLRHTAARLGRAKPGKGWIKEAKVRLAPIGNQELHARLDEWFTIPPQEASLSPAGSSMLRLLIWYGIVADAQHNLPVLIRLANVPWNKRAAAGKIMAALAWALRIHAGSAFRSEAEWICTQWADTSAEVRRLEEIYLPECSQARKQAEDLARESRRSEVDEWLKARLVALREKYPHRFLPDGSVRPFATWNEP